MATHSRQHQDQRTPQEDLVVAEVDLEDPSGKVLALEGVDHPVVSAQLPWTAPILEIVLVKQLTR